MADDPQNPQEEQPPEEQSGFIEGVERTPEVDETLREYGIDPDNPEDEEKKEEVSSEQTTTSPDAEQPPAQEEKPTAPVEETPTQEKENTVTEEAAQKQIEEQLGEKKQANEQYPWETEGREPTQRELLEYIAQKSADIQEQRKVDAQKQQEQQKEQKLAEYQQMWKGNLEFLESNNYIPKSAEGHYTDPNDVGNKARAILHEQAVLHNEMDLEKVYWRYAKPLIDGKQPPGANAPIATQVNANTEAKENDDEFYYDEIHGHDPSREYDSLELNK